MVLQGLSPSSVLLVTPGLSREVKSVKWFVMFSEVCIALGLYKELASSFMEPTV